MSPRGISGGAVLAHVRAQRRAAAAVPGRRASVALMPNGGHVLNLSLGVFDFALSRDHAQRLAEGLAATDDELVLSLLSPLLPALQGLDDVQFLRRAVHAFAEEMAFEDRRGEARSHRAVKPLEA